MALTEPYTTDSGEEEADWNTVVIVPENHINNPDNVVYNRLNACVEQNSRLLTDMEYVFLWSVRGSLIIMG